MAFYYINKTNRSNDATENLQVSSGFLWGFGWFPSGYRGYPKGFRDFDGVSGSLQGVSGGFQEVDFDLNCKTFKPNDDGPTDKT